MSESESEIKKKVEIAREGLFRMIFESVASDPRHWRSYAISLRMAVGILQPHFAKELKTPKVRGEKGIKLELGPIYLLLVGFAVENLAKAIFVITNPNVIKDDKLIKLNRHDVLSLLKDIKFKINSVEEEFLERLEQFILWAGRYPIPSKLEHLLPKKRKQPGLGEFLIYSIPSDIKTANKILDRLELQLTKEMKVQDDFQRALSGLTSHSSRLRSE